MDSDESRHSESEFYYPEEETLNQMAPINFFPNFKKKRSDHGHSFFPYGPRRLVNNIYLLYD